MKKVLILLAGIMSMVVQCSLFPTAASDGGSTSEVTAVNGQIFNHDGSPGSDVQVMLIPDTYNPVESNPLPASHIVTTNKSGEFTFEIKNYKNCNIQAVHLVTRTRLLMTNVALRDEPIVGKKIFLPPDTLHDAGAIKIVFPDTVDTMNGYICIFGTTLFKPLLHEVIRYKGSFAVVLDSVPVHTIPSIYYGTLNDLQAPLILTDTVVVYSNDITVTEAYVFWANYTLDNTGLPGNTVSDIFWDGEGTIWFATYNGAARLNAGAWTVYDSKNSALPGDTVYALCRTSNGSLWVGTEAGAASFDGTTWSSYTASCSGLPANPVRGIAQDSKGDVWFGTWGGGIIKMSQSGWSGFDSAVSGLPSMYIYGLAFDTADTLWAATECGIGKYTGTGWTVYNLRNSEVPANRTTAVMVDRNGNPWFGHGNGSVSVFRAGSFVVYDGNCSSVLTGGQVNDIAADTYGNLWVITDAGLAGFNGSVWTDYTGERYRFLEGKKQISIIIDENEDKWIGTLQEGLFSFGPTKKVL